MQKLIQFRKPKRNTKFLYDRERARQRGVDPTSCGARTNVKQLSILIPRKKYVNLLIKAKGDLNTPFPVHDILELLLAYYLENELIIRSQVVKADDPTVSIDTGEKKILQCRRTPEEGQEERVTYRLSFTHNHREKEEAG